MDVTRGKYIDVKELRRQYSEFLQEHEMFFFDLDTFPDLIAHCYLMERYIGGYEIDGKLYDVHAFWAEYQDLGIPEPGFCFYTCFLSDDIPDLPTMTDYAEARAIYRTEALDPDDFPIWMDIVGDFTESTDQQEE